MRIPELEFLTEKEAARVLECHPETLRRWRREGRIAHSVSPTGRVRYRPIDLVKFREWKRVDPA